MNGTNGKQSDFPDVALVPYSSIGKSRARNTATGSKLAACGRQHALRGDKPLQPQSERSERRRQWVKLP